MTKTVVYQNKNIVLSDSNYLSAGGEGEIYLKGGVIFKIYTKPVNPQLLDKIKELSVLDRPNIIRPLELIFDPNTNQPVGYTMAYADNSVGLPLLFTTSFLDRTNISLKSIQELIEEMAKTLAFIHSKQVLVVDHNENNILVSKGKKYTQPYFIDVDSWQTSRFPATAIMPSIKDFRASKFSEFTDWYSHAVLSFQLLTGIHPYKGKHDVFKNIEERRKNLVSVFHKDVRLPASVRDFANIPPAYRSWYEDIFDKGLEVLPPAMVATPTVRIKRKYSNVHFIVEKILETKEPIVYSEWINGTLVAATEHYVYVNKVEYNRPTPDAKVFFGDEGGLYFAFMENGDLTIQPVKKGENVKDIYIKPTKLFTIGGRLYALDIGRLYEFSLREKMNVLITVMSPMINTLSTKVYDQVVHTEMFGEKYFYCLPATKTFVPFHAKGLKEYKIWDAQMRGTRLQIIATTKTGDPVIITYQLSKTWDKGLLMNQEPLPAIRELNSITIANGMVVDYDADDDQVKITSADLTQEKIIKDAGLPQGAQLVSGSTSVYYQVDNEVRKISMKQP